jgi:polar amino acid transport system substrate-binding protein
MCVLCLLSSPLAAQETLKLSVGQNAAPIALAVKIVEAAYEKLGIRIELLRMSRSRALVLASTGQVDGEIAGPKMFEREFPALRRVDVPIMQIDIMTYSCDPDLMDRENLSEQRWGRINGSILLERYTKDYRNVWLGENFTELFGMLKLGRLDAVVGPGIALHLYEKRNETGCIRAVGAPLGTIDFYHYLHEKNAILIPRVTEVLRNMRSSGEMKSITDAFYGLSDEDDEASRS